MLALSSSLLLTVVIQSKVAAELAGAFLSAPEASSSGASGEFFAPLPVEMLPPGAAETSRPTNERAGELRSWEPAAAVLGIAADVRERVPSFRTRSRALGWAIEVRLREEVAISSANEVDWRPSKSKLSLSLSSRVLSLSYSLPLSLLPWP